MVGAIALHAAIDALDAARLGRRRGPRARRWPTGSSLGLAADRRGPPARPGRSRDDRRRDAAGGAVHRRGDAPRPGGRPAERRVRDRRAPRLLLRPSLRRPAAGHGPDRRRRLPTRGAARGPPRDPGGGPGQRRTRHVGGRHRRAAGRGGRAGRWRPPARPLRAGPGHRRLLPGHRRAGLARRRPASSVRRARVDDGHPLPTHLRSAGASGRDHLTPGPPREAGLLPPPARRGVAGRAVAAGLAGCTKATVTPSGRRGRRLCGGRRHRGRTPATP